ncbi:MAG: Clp protease N-terminal domain-containing protein, partial [Solirubrobacteraceae bacterium]
MQPDRFTIKSQEALQAAQELADQRRNPQTTPEHLLAVLLEQNEGIVAPVLRKLGVQPGAVRQALQPRLQTLPTVSRGSAPAEPVGGSTELAQVLRTAEAEMRELGDEYVSTEHLLLALAGAQMGTSPGAGSGAGEVLRELGADHDALLQALGEVRGSHRVTDQSPED